MTDSEINQYVNPQAIFEILGCFVKKPSLMDTYKVFPTDLTEGLHKIILSALKKLHKSGANQIDSSVIDEFLGSYPTEHMIFTKQNGAKFIDLCASSCHIENIDYSFDQIKKFSLLREYLKSGIDVCDYYAPNEIDPQLMEAKRDILDKSSILDIINHFKQKQLDVASQFIVSGEKVSKKAGTSGHVQKELWKQSVAWGAGYASAFMTTISHGIRPGRFTIMSAASGTGKTRYTIANLCYAFSPRYYDKREGKWMDNPYHTDEGALYIGTEMELLDEIEPILWAYISDVPQEHIQYNLYEPGEEDRVDIAINILEQESHIYLAYLPNYDVASLEATIEEHVLKYKIKHVFFDYIHTTAELLSEFTHQSGGHMALREDQALSNLGNELKNMSRRYNVSIDSWTQVSTNIKDDANRDASVIQGAKALVNKADLAAVVTRPTAKELIKLEDTIRHLGMTEPPNLVISVYKNRGGKYTDVKVWLYVNYDTMRVHDLFCTDTEYDLYGAKVAGLGKRYIGSTKVGSGDKNKLYSDMSADVFQPDAEFDSDGVPKNNFDYYTVNEADRVEVEEHLNEKNKADDFDFIF